MALHAIEKTSFTFFECQRQQMDVNLKSRFTLFESQRCKLTFYYLHDDTIAFAIVKSSSYWTYLIFPYFELIFMI